MRNFLLGATLMALLAFTSYHFLNRSNTEKTAIESSGLILDQIQNTGKLIVTEGHFSDVITYKNNKTYFNVLSSKKKIIVLVNAKAQISYDLRKIKHSIDTKNKTITITSIPQPETTITPEIKYHDIQEGLINKFNPEDHNAIQKIVLQELNKKVQNSILFYNAKNRLVSELQNLYILTNSLGWTLKYNDAPINNYIDLNILTN